MEIKSLEKIGLTRNESLVYTSLLRLGNSKTGEILKKSGLNSGKIYEILNSLKSKGLVSESVINNVKHFTAANPKRLHDFIESKEKELESEKLLVKKLIPELSNLQEEDNNVMAKTFIGFEGLKTAIDESLDSMNVGSQSFAMGLTGLKNEKINRFWKDYFHPKRIQKKIFSKMIFSEEKTDYLKSFKKLPLAKVRTSSILTMAPISIYGNKVLISSYDDPIITILIESEKIAKSFVEVFDQLWKSAKP